MNTWWKSLMLFFGMPVMANSGKCCKCYTTAHLIDLGDGDRICIRCWNKHDPMARKP